MKARIKPKDKKIVDKVYCDECKNEIFMSTVNIEETTVTIGGQEIILVYFACPKCDKIYRIMLKDERYEELVADLERTKQRIQKNYGSGKEEFARTLNSMVAKKHERLRNHVDNLNNKRFPGTFTFVASENNHEEKIIKYLP